MTGQTIKNKLQTTKEETIQINASFIQRTTFPIREFTYLNYFDVPKAPKNKNKNNKKPVPKTNGNRNDKLLGAITSSISAEAAI